MALRPQPTHIYVAGDASTDLFILRPGRKKGGHLLLHSVPNGAALFYQALIGLSKGGTAFQVDAEVAAKKPYAGPADVFELTSFKPAGTGAPGRSGADDDEDRWKVRERVGSPEPSGNRLGDVAPADGANLILINDNCRGAHLRLRNWLK